ncbi:hypothetical protein RA8P2_00153 (plasmid) [Variovorax sp. RA8]|nr:hypothetical protein RA8P2_00153 [Variovorax sp. RA8]
MAMTAADPKVRFLYCVLAGGIGLRELLQRAQQLLGNIHASFSHCLLVKP